MIRSIQRVWRKPRQMRHFIVPIRSSLDSNLPLEVHRKRLLYRCSMTGLKELDVVLGNWAKLHLENLDEKQIEELTEILNEESVDLQKWMAQKHPIPSHLNENSVANSILAFRDAGNVANCP